VKLLDFILLLAVFLAPAVRYSELLSEGLINGIEARLLRSPATLLPEQVEPWFERARAFSPLLDIPLLEQGRWTLAQGETARALGLFEAALERAPESRAARFFRATALVEIGRPAAAAQEFRKAGLPDPETSGYDLLTDRAWNEVLSGRPGGPTSRHWRIAELYYRTAIEFTPERRQPWENLAGFFFDLDRPAEGLEVLTEAAELFPDESWPAIQAAEFEEARGSIVSALNPLTKPLLRNPDDGAVVDLALRLVNQASRQEARDWISGLEGELRKTPDGSAIAARLNAAVDRKESSE